MASIPVQVKTSPGLLNGVTETIVGGATGRVEMTAYGLALRVAISVGVSARFQIMRRLSLPLTFGDVPSPAPPIAQSSGSAWSNGPPLSIAVATGAGVTPAGLT